MDPQATAQKIVDTFNDRTFRDTASDFVHQDIAVKDGPTGQEFNGPDGYIQYSESFLTAMPDLKATITDKQVSGNNVLLTVQGQGTFTGELETPEGTVPGNGSTVELEYQLAVEVDNDKIVRFTVDYDAQEFMQQIGLG